MRHTHEWIIEHAINIPESMFAEVHEVCIAEGDCDRDNEQIRTVFRDRLVVINPN